MSRNSRLSLDSWSTGGLTSASVLQILVISIGAEPSGGGASLGVTTISGFTDQVTDFFADVSVLLTLVLASEQQHLGGDAPTHFVGHRSRGLSSSSVTINVSCHETFS